MDRERFIVEVGKRALGVAVRVQGGFQFFASDPAVRQLDGMVFPREERLVARAKEVLLTNEKDRASNAGLPFVNGADPM